MRQEMLRLYAGTLTPPQSLGATMPASSESDFREQDYGYSPSPTVTPPSALAFQAPSPLATQPPPAARLAQPPLTAQHPPPPPPLGAPPPLKAPRQQQQLPLGVTATMNANSNGPASGWMHSARQAMGKKPPQPGGQYPCLSMATFEASGAGDVPPYGSANEMQIASLQDQSQLVAPSVTPRGSGANNNYHSSKTGDERQPVTMPSQFHHDPSTMATQGGFWQGGASTASPLLAPPLPSPTPPLSAGVMPTRSLVDHGAERSALSSIVKISSLQHDQLPIPRQQAQQVPQYRQLDNNQQQRQQGWTRSESGDFACKGLPSISANIPITPTPPAEASPTAAAAATPVVGEGQLAGWGIRAPQTGRVPGAAADSAAPTTAPDSVKYSGVAPSATPSKQERLPSAEEQELQEALEASKKGVVRKVLSMAADESNELAAVIEASRLVEIARQQEEAVAKAAMDVSGFDLVDLRLRVFVCFECPRTL